MSTALAIELYPEEKARVLKPPTPLNLNTAAYKIFLAGSIEQGRASNWQDKVTQSLLDKEVLLLNPRRDRWDSSWREDRSEPQFRMQVEWELEAQERADRIAMYFEPSTMSPITLLEFGLFARSGRLVVCCPPGYWRKGNVEMVCERYDVPLLDDLEEMIELLRAEVPE